jgi:hypothetical protein
MKNKLQLLLALLLFSLLLGWIKPGIAATVSKNNNKSFSKDEMRWREKRDKQMRSQDSWLTITGLYWLKEGENSFGTDPANKIILPQDSAPLLVGKFIFNKGIITVKNSS